ncbi:hypothetical protein [Acaryochloris thomasi]|uniref:hypothetical protein n=1 Tax=Acaryochloris thomasi TaxID=2929456 RepID=UPI001F30B636|nr:hypothetical protein [Acaryochloris thomasi]
MSAAIEYADTQASLYGSLGDAANYRYWVKVWWSLTSACDCRRQARGHRIAGFLGVGVHSRLSSSI